MGCSKVENENEQSAGRIIDQNQRICQVFRYQLCHSGGQLLSHLRGLAIIQPEKGSQLMN